MWKIVCNSVLILIDLSMAKGMATYQTCILALLMHKILKNGERWVDWIT